MVDFIIAIANGETGVRYTPPASAYFHSTISRRSIPAGGRLTKLGAVLLWSQESFY